MACSCGALEYLIAGLEDSAEDVSAVAAGALAPAARALARSADGARVPQVAARLWRLLRDQDDLAAPAHSYMALLAALTALPQAARLLQWVYKLLPNGFKMLIFQVDTNITFGDKL